MADEFENKVKDTSAEAQLTAAKADAYMTLTPEERDSLSLVLFPDTHTDKVTLLEKERKLKPVPIKYAKQIHILMQPITREINIKSKSEDKTLHDIDSILLDSLKSICLILAEFYKWPDVQVAVEDGMIQTSELQILAMTQAKLNGESDFLLGGLRAVILMMQHHEIITRKSMNLQIMLRSLKTSTVPSTNSSALTQMDS